MFPALASQYVWLEKDDEPTDLQARLIINTEDENSSRKTTYDVAMRKNEIAFTTYAKNSKHISLILGNGVSIPFGSEGWQDLVKNLLGQLQPRFIERVDDIDKFLGENDLSTADFSFDMLNYYGCESQYWKALKYSIYRRFNQNIWSDDSALKAIAESKYKLKGSLLLYTYNYDVFLEKQYERLYPEEKLIPITELSSIKVNDVPDNVVIHVHGVFLDDMDKGHDIVLSSTDYFEQYHLPYISKKMQCLFKSFQNDICLFIGSSMTDIFQMNMLAEALRQAEKSKAKQSVFALMCLKDLKPKEKEAIYRYYVRKRIYLISFDDFETLPNKIRDLLN